MEAAKTHEELRAELVGKAAKDDGFRAKLVADPKAAVKEALNVDLPESITVHVHEDGPLSAHLVLPPSAGLSDAELETVTAGHVSSEKAIYDSGYDHQHRQPDGSWGPVHQ